MIIRLEMNTEFLLMCIYNNKINYNNKIKLYYYNFILLHIKHEFLKNTYFVIQNCNFILIFSVVYSYIYFDIFHLL